MLTEEAVHQFLVLYMWFPFSALLLLLALVARFYQKFSNQATYFRWYALPVILLGVAAVRYASTKHIASDPASNLLVGLAGLVLLALVLRLARLMLQPTKQAEVA